MPAMGIGKTIWGQWTRAVLLVVLALPLGTRALASGGETKVNLPPGVSQLGLYDPPLVLALDSEWPIAGFWTASRPLVFATLRAPAMASAGDSGSPAFDIARYNPMWDDGLFSEIAAYGGLERDVQRLAGMQASGGSDDAGGIPYGRLTLGREFLEGQDQLALGAYGLHINVQPTAISGFGYDSYTDIAADGTYRWVAGPGRSAAALTAHILVLHEGEDLNASHAVFGTRSTDDLTVFRADVGWSPVGWSPGAVATPRIQYFQSSGSADPLRLGTLEGSPNSRGLIAQMGYAPSASNAAMARLNCRFALQFIAYSKFDGSPRNVSHDDTVLLHVALGAGPDN